MSLDVQAAPCLTVGDQGSEKNYCRVMQLTISFDLCRYFSSIFFRHDNVEQNNVWLKFVRSLIGLRWVILLQNNVRTGPFQKDFHEVRAVRIVIDNQDSPF